MSYIGKSPAVGNFVKLDAISTSSTNTYNLTLDSVAFVPESANHMLVSLNGVIQAPLSSFSVSGSTITFLPASGTLTSSDSIDFIMVYGNVLDIGVPSDSTVTNAKTNFVSTSSSAGLQIKGDGTTDGTLQLNCSQNSHGIKLKSPPHSASASYTLTFPNNDGSSGETLTTNGSGVLSWASAGGITEADVFRKTSTQTISAGTGTTISGFSRDNEATFSKIGTGLSESSGVFTFGATGIYFVTANFYLQRNGDLTYASLYIDGTNNDSSYVNLAYNDQSIKQVSGNTYACNYISAIFDCQNTSTYKVRMGAYGTQDFDVLGASGTNHTYLTAIKLADT